MTRSLWISCFTPSLSSAMKDRRQFEPPRPRRNKGIGMNRRRTRNSALSERPWGWSLTMTKRGREDSVSAESGDFLFAHPTESRLRSRSQARLGELCYPEWRLFASLRPAATRSNAADDCAAMSSVAIHEAVHYVPGAAQAVDLTRPVSSPRRKDQMAPRFPTRNQGSCRETRATACSGIRRTKR